MKTIVIFITQNLALLVELLFSIISISDFVLNIYLDI